MPKTNNRTKPPGSAPIRRRAAFRAGGGGAGGKSGTASEGPSPARDKEPDNLASDVFRPKRSARTTPSPTAGPSLEPPQKSSLPQRPCKTKKVPSPQGAVGGIDIEADMQLHPSSGSGARAQTGLSTIASGSCSSTSCMPMSSSSNGPLWHQPSPIDEEIRAHLGDTTTDCTIKSLSDIDVRLEDLTQRMQKFENDLCTTVDAILDILGHKPRIPHPRTQLSESAPPRISYRDATNTTSDTARVGAGLVRSKSELERVLQNA